MSFFTMIDYKNLHLTNFYFLLCISKYGLMSSLFVQRLPPCKTRIKFVPPLNTFLIRLPT